MQLEYPKKKPSEYAKCGHKFLTQFISNLTSRCSLKFENYFQKNNYTNKVTRKDIKNKKES
jgi:hypothetical protein